MEWRERDGVRWLQADLDGAGAAFSTRLGGVSKPPFDSLNLDFLTADDGEAVEENRRRLARALGFEPDQIVFARQVHGAELIDHHLDGVSEIWAPGGAKSSEASREGDGHMLREPGAVALVFVADCLPVALAGPRGVAMVHAGWRGLAGGILAKGAEAVAATSAAIGPGIGPCCYEVGHEVLDLFSGLGNGVATDRMLDLAEAARRLLAQAGVERVESAGLCASCEEELFFSHRRDRGRTGRQGGLAWIEV
jgi:purine-nucleoside/S-methyl-5'-thioadenosine phosphorylase / adenosine deaminase